VQVCHREYMAGLREAGFQCRDVVFKFTNGFAQKLGRRVSPRLATMDPPANLLAEIEQALGESKATTVFFGFNVFPDLSCRLKQSFPEVRQVLLSHGAESLDYCVEQRMRRRNKTENRRSAVAERLLGRELMDEVAQRHWVDAVLTLSPFEAEIERWLGARKSLWVPRTILEPALDVHPIDGRVGCVSTLNHPPNLDGLESLFDALEGVVPPEFRFRLVGQPSSHGKALAARYPFVEYLGPLPDSDLRSEASTWCCFVHPLFVYAKGCSTKLGVALGWGLPIATTRFGARGYVWDENVVPLVDAPVELAQLAVERSRGRRFEFYQGGTKKLCAAAPTIGAVGASIRNFVLG